MSSQLTTIFALSSRPNSDGAKRVERETKDLLFTLPSIRWKSGKHTGDLLQRNHECLESSPEPFLKNAGRRLRGPIRPPGFREPFRSPQTTCPQMEPPAPKNRPPLRIAGKVHPTASRRLPRASCRNIIGLCPRSEVPPAEYARTILRKQSVFREPPSRSHLVPLSPADAIRATRRYCTASLRRIAAILSLRNSCRPAPPSTRVLMSFWLLPWG
jgi:hypothetical protein